MAKKRKLRSTASDAQSEPQEEQLEPQQEDPQSDATMVQEEEQTDKENMAVDNQEGEEVEEEVQEVVVEGEEEVEEEAEDEENQNLDASNGGPTAEPQSNGTEEEADEEEFDQEPVEKLLEPFSKDQLVVLLKKAVDKFPELMESVREVADADPAHRKIFVHGLGWDATADTLKSEFSKYGEIEDCKAVTDRVSGKSKGYAFILFKHRSGARNALKQPQKKIGNRTTSCQLASAGPVPAPPPTAPPVSEYTQRKIFVSNVAAEIDPQKLLDFFKQYGEIEDGPLGLDKQTGKPKGFALFVYKTVESSKKALEEPHKNFEGHLLHCQRAIDGPKPSKQPYGVGGHHHHHQPHYNQRKEKNKYMSGGPGAHGHLMAPAAPTVGFNQPMPQQGLNPALGQALTALLATQGAGLGFGNLLGGLGGAPVNHPGPPAGYGNQAGVGYGNQPMQGGYPNPQMGQSSGRPQQGGGAPYMGH